MVEKRSLLSDKRKMIMRQEDKPQDTLYSLNENWISTQRLVIAKMIKDSKTNDDLENAFKQVQLNLIKEVFNYRYSICGGNLRSLLHDRAERALRIGSLGNRGNFLKRFYFLSAACRRGSFRGWHSPMY